MYSLEVVHAEASQVYDIDLVIPCLNEAEFAQTLIKEIEYTIKNGIHYLSGPKPVFSIIIIDDGSVDATADIFADLLAHSDMFLRKSILRFSRNFGKESALVAGLAHCKGEASIILDADLQDPPGLIFEMISAWAKGSQVVNAIRKDRSSDSLLKRIPAALFYLTFAKFSHLKISFNASDFRLLDQVAVKAILECPERIRFSKGFFAWIGFEQTDIYYPRPARQIGESKWTTWKLWNYALDGLFNFSTAPLRIWSYIGIACLLLSFSQGLYVLLRVLYFGIEVPGYASLFLAIIFLGGLQLVGIGIIGEYVGRIYIESKRRPHYIIREIIELAEISSERS